MIAGSSPRRAMPALTSSGCSRMSLMSSIVPPCITATMDGGRYTMTKQSNPSSSIVFTVAKVSLWFEQPVDHFHHRCDIDILPGVEAPHQVVGLLSPSRVVDLAEVEAHLTALAHDIAGDRAALFERLPGCAPH